MLTKMKCPICHKDKFKPINSWSDVEYNCGGCGYVEIY